MHSPCHPKVSDQLSKRLLTGWLVTVFALRHNLHKSPEAATNFLLRLPVSNAKFFGKRFDVKALPRANMRRRPVASQPLGSIGGEVHLRDGFTLVELLVVIAIISILGALLLPSLRAAKGQAKSIKCVTNERQLMLATIQYAHEHDDRLPTSNGYDEEGVGGFWNQLLPYLGKSYTGASPVLYCPAWGWDDQNMYTYTKWCPNGGFDAGHANYARITYAAFQTVYRSDGGWFYVMGPGVAVAPQTQLSSISNPSIVMAYMCAGSDIIPPTYTIQILQYQYPTSLTGWAGQASPYVGYVHNGKANIAFLDGHVETLTREKAAIIAVP